MPITIGANIASLGVQRQLAKGSDALGRVFERLSSGQRINRASDDAAGLAVSLSLNSDTRVFTQAIRNANDAISAVSIAGEALGALSGIVTRQKELAEQAANGTYSLVQRRALDEEANQLVDEFNRIAATTKFNGVNLFGSTINIQVGAGAGSVIGVDFASSALRTHGDGTFSATYTELDVSSTVGLTIATGDLNGDGVSDIVTGNHTNSSVSIIIGNGDGTYRAAVSISMGGGNIGEVTLADIDKNGTVDILTRVGGAVGILKGNGNGTFLAAITYAAPNGLEGQFGDFNNDGNLDYIAPWTASGIGINLGNGDGSFRAAATVLSATAATATDTFITDLNNDGNLDYAYLEGGAGSIQTLLGRGDGTFSQGSSIGSGLSGTFAFGDLDRDGVVDLISYSTPNTIVSMGIGDGTFRVATSFTNSGSTATRNYLHDLNADGNLDLVSYRSSGAPSTIYTRLGNGDGTFGAASALSHPAQFTDYQMGFADVTGDGASDLVFLEETGTPSAVVFTANATSDLTQAHFSLLSQSDARTALSELTTTFDRISSGLASLGASESRLLTAVSNLSSSRDEYARAASRITDADIGFESSQLVRTQLLQRAGAAVLAQANLQPQLVLKLLE